MQSGGGYGQLERRCRKKEQLLQIGCDFQQKSGIDSLDDLKEMKAEMLLKLANDYGFPCHLPISKEGGLLAEKCIYEESYEKIPCLLGSNKNDIRVTEEMLQKGIPSDLYVGNIEFAKRYGKEKGCYLYFFERQLPGDTAGAFHSAELWYMFGTLGRSWRPFSQEDYLLSEKMLDAWCRFVKEGHSGKTEEEWAAYREENPYIHIWG